MAIYCADLAPDINKGVGARSGRPLPPPSRRLSS
jgi:hypothetical protein